MILSLSITLSKSSNQVNTKNKLKKKTLCSHFHHFH